MIKKDTVEGNETSPICWGHKLEDIVGRGGKESVKAAKTQIFKEKNNHAYYMHVQLNW